MPHMLMNLLQGNVCVWSDVMIHKFILSVSGLSDFSSTAGFCLLSSFQSFDTSAFNFDSL